MLSDPDIRPHTHGNEGKQPCHKDGRREVGAQILHQSQRHSRRPIWFSLPHEVSL